MQKANINRAVLEAQQFIARAREFLAKTAIPDGEYDYKGKVHKTCPAAPLESGALRRASLDLTRSLAAMRRP